jgi:hypothetical protein
MSRFTQIWHIFIPFSHFEGPWGAHEGHWEALRPGSIFLNICLQCYLFVAIWGLNHLDFTGYNNIYLDFANLGAFLAFSKAFGSSRDPWTILVSLYV